MTEEHKELGEYWGEEVQQARDQEVAALAETLRSQLLDHILNRRVREEVITRMEEEISKALKVMYSRGYKDAL